MIVVILKHLNDNKKNNNIPHIRIHSESIFNRFPLKNRKYHNKFKKAIFKIVKNGNGIITLFHYDGKGCGLGYYLLNYDKMENIEYKSILKKL